MATLAALLAVACLGAGVFHLLRLVLVRTDPAAEGSHAAMGLGMAAMFAPVGDPVPGPVWVAVFALGAAWFAGAALRAPAGPARSDAVHHVVGGGAMVFMLLAGHGQAPGPASSVAAVVLAGYFGWHVMRCGDRLGPTAVPRQASALDVARVRLMDLRDARVVARAHAALAAAMTGMLLGAI